MTTSIHSVAAHGYASAGTVYEQGRPSYPADAIACLVEVLGITAAIRVLDVGAGTGKLTQLLRPTAAQLVAVEPVAQMRNTFAQLLPDVWLAGGVAEALPLRDQSVDVIVAGTCFHWFDGPVALREIHRVLRPGGRLGLIWNARDLSVDWVRRLVDLVGTYMRGDPPRYEGSGAWRAPFETTTLFTPLEERHFPFAHEGDKQMVLKRVRSTSFIGALPADERERALTQVEQLLDSHPDTQGRQTVSLPYVSDVYWCTRREEHFPS
ncbi:MAG TPA: class I SAM-dependent methyltransferase [Chloroflexota bacterium]|nr:class I SAM-dependent methyltransferase [Chloroflexota bacterium]